MYRFTVSDHIFDVAVSRLPKKKIIIKTPKKLIQFQNSTIFEAFWGIFSLF